MQSLLASERFGFPHGVVLQTLKGLTKWPGHNFSQHWNPDWVEFGVLKISDQLRRKREIGAQFEVFSGANIKFSSTTTRQKQAIKNLCRKWHCRQNLRLAPEKTSIRAPILNFLLIDRKSVVKHVEQSLPSRVRRTCVPNSELLWHIFCDNHQHDKRYNTEKNNFERPPWNSVHS